MNHNQPTNGFKKGHKKIEGSGRKPGQQNRVSDDLKQALLNAATRVGFIHEEDILGEDGKPTGQTRKTCNGEGGLEGYLMWAAVYRASHFIPLLGRVMPLQANVRTEQHTKVVYETVEQARARLIARRIDPEVLERAMAPKWPAPPPLPRPGGAQ